MPELLGDSGEAALDAIEILQQRLAKAEAERDEWKREAIHHSELGLAADAANQALRNDLAKAEAERDGARADRAVATEDFLRIKAERDEARAENEQCAKDYREECDKRDAAEASLTKAVEGLRDIADGKFTRLGDTHASARAARSILAEIEESE